MSEEFEEFEIGKDGYIELKEGKSAVASSGVLGSLSVSGIGLGNVIESIISSGSLPASVQPYALIILGAIALYGRLTAKKKITSVLPQKSEP